MIIVTFSGLDPAKKYLFVCTTTRNNFESYDPERWTKISILDADSYDNYSSEGVLIVSDGIVKINAPDNNVYGYVAAWKNISPGSDRTFAINSENVGAEGPGALYHFYGLQGFKLAEIAD